MIRRVVALVLAAMLPLLLLVPSPSGAASSAFSDVPTTHPQHTEITWAVERGLLPDYANPDGTRRFEPTVTTTRGDLAETLFRLRGAATYSAPAQSPFADVSTSHPQYRPIAWMYERGFALGTVTNGVRRYSPTSAVLQRDLAVILYRVAGKPTFKPPATSPFADVPTTLSQYPQIAWVADQGIWTGTVATDGTRRFTPAAQVPRSQVAVVLYRLEGAGAAAPPVRDVAGVITGDVVWGPSTAAVHRVTGDVTVAAGSTLTLLPGTVMKFAAGRRLVVDGSVRADGTASSPVVLTSLKDDTVAGDTNGDGASTSAAAGDFEGVSVSATGSLSMTHARVANANTAITSTGSEVGSPLVSLASTAVSRSTMCVVAFGPVRGTFSGSVRDCRAGVSADHAFDARNVDWGSPSGPAPYGTGVAIQGLTVSVFPWTGYVAPARPRVAAAQPAPAVAECRDVVLVGVRGSGEAPQAEAGASRPTFAADDSGFGGLNANLAVSTYVQIATARPTTSFKVVALQYQALDTPLYSPAVNHPAYLGSVFDGIDKLRQLITSELARCPASNFVLMGSSQGAMVIHQALFLITTATTRDRIAGVVLIADPTRAIGGSDTLWQTADTPATTGVRDVPGIWTDFHPGFGRPIPTWAAPRTTSLCHQGDAMCAFRPGATLGPHVDYSQPELDAVAAQQGARITASLVRQHGS